MQTDFEYRDGQFHPINEKFGPDYLETNCHKSQEVGPQFGLSYVLYSEQSEDNDEIGWFVEFGTAGTYCLIHVCEWPDLIDLLGKLSAIVLPAAIDPQDWEAIDELLEPTRVDLARRRQRRIELSKRSERKGVE